MKKKKNSIKWLDDTVCRQSATSWIDKKKCRKMNRSNRLSGRQINHNKSSNLKRPLNIHRTDLVFIHVVFLALSHTHANGIPNDEDAKENKQNILYVILVRSVLLSAQPPTMFALSFNRHSTVRSPTRCVPFMSNGFYFDGRKSENKNEFENELWALSTPRAAMPPNNARHQIK